jgi:2-(1,2-epoxy-1,2-dihydrophenyl)acetyl-CoA isomerase
MTDQLIVGRQDAVATVTFNRPEARNALSLDMRAALCEAMLGLERDKAVRCVVLRGTGDHFMGGGDIKRFHGIIDNDPEELYAGFLNGIQEMHRAIVAMRRMGKPVVASVRGAAAGLGCSLVLACDLAIAADDAFFTLAYSRLGTSPDGSGSYFLPRTVGTKKAAEIALLGDRYDAETAKELGMINWVVPAAELEAETDKLARRLAQGPTHAYGNTKRLLHDSPLQTLPAQLQAEAESFADCAVTQDFKEGVRAFVEKRAAKFRGE